MGKIYTAITPASDFDQSKIEKLAMRVEKISHVIAIIMKRDEKERVPIQEEEYAVSCAVQNMLLATNSLDIIGYWGTGKLAFSNEMKTFLKLNKEDKCLGFLQLGVPMDDLPQLQKKPMSPIQDKVEWR